MESPAAQDGVRLSLLLPSLPQGLALSRSKAGMTHLSGCSPKLLLGLFCFVPSTRNALPTLQRQCKPCVSSRPERALGHLLHPQTLSLSAQGSGLSSRGCLILPFNTLAQPAPHASSRSSPLSSVGFCTCYFPVPASLVQFPFRSFKPPGRHYLPESQSQ